MLRTLFVDSSAIFATSLTGCAAMYEQSINNLRRDGQHARADCYERCEPSDLMCQKDCDNAHPKQLHLSEEQKRLLDAAAAQDAAKASQQGGPSSSGPTSSSPTSRSTSTRTLTINGHTYTGGEHLGKPCNLNSPCPDGYQCHLVTDSSGQCVQ